MSRRWVAGAGWVADPTPRTCRSCRAALPGQNGRGGRLRYCAEHAPARRGYMTAWQREHMDAIRARQRELYGYRPLRSFTCADCGTPTCAYADANRCAACRARARHRGPSSAATSRRPDGSLACQLRCSCLTRPRPGRAVGACRRTVGATRRRASQAGATLIGVQTGGRGCIERGDGEIWTPIPRSARTPRRFGERAKRKRSQEKEMQ